MKVELFKNFFINYLTLNLLSIFFYSGIYYYLIKDNLTYHFRFPNEDIRDKLSDLHVNNNNNNKDKDKDNDNVGASYLNAIYFSVITQLSIGYGDVTPRSKETKIVSICQGITILIITFICFSSLFQNYEIKS